MSRNLWFVLFLFLILTAATARSAIVHAAVTNGGSGDVFGALDTLTGAFTAIGPQTVNLSGMGFAPNGTLYATDSASPAGVYSVDPTTGATTLLGSSNDSAFGSTVGSDGLIYVVDDAQMGITTFYSIDPTTLSVKLISFLGFATDGLAVFSGGVFYTDFSDGAGTNNDLLEAVNPVTGFATAIGSGLGVPIVAGTNVNGTIYGAGTDGNLYTINPNTGVATFVVAITGLNGGQVDALAFESAPEPSSLFCVAIGLGAVGLIRMRRVNCADGRNPSTGPRPAALRSR